MFLELKNHVFSPFAKLNLTAISYSPITTSTDFYQSCIFWSHILPRWLISQTPPVKSLRAFISSTDHKCFSKLSIVIYRGRWWLVDLFCTWTFDLQVKFDLDRFKPAILAAIFMAHSSNLYTNHKCFWNWKIYQLFFLWSLRCGYIR